MAEPQSFIEFAKHNWVQMGIFLLGVVGILIGTQARRDKHGIDKSTKFNIDVDTLSDSFDLSQKLLKSLRIQLDETQLLLDKANNAYDLLEMELLKAKEVIINHEKMIKELVAERNALRADNKFLMDGINTCEFDCNIKRTKHKNEKSNGTNN